jgi:hypothetical protein
MNTVTTQTEFSRDLAAELNIIRDLIEVEVCLVGGGEVIYVGN